LFGCVAVTVNTAFDVGIVDVPTLVDVVTVRTVSPTRSEIVPVVKFAEPTSCAAYVHDEPGFPVIAGVNGQNVGTPAAPNVTVYVAVEVANAPNRFVHVTVTFTPVTPVGTVPPVATALKVIVGDVTV
jgi:hypothetical protein